MKRILITALLAGSVVLWGCSREEADATIDEAGDAVNEAVKDTKKAASEAGDAIEDAADATEEAAEDAADEVEDEARDLAN